MYSIKMYSIKMYSIKKIEILLFFCNYLYITTLYKKAIMSSFYRTSNKSHITLFCKFCYDCGRGDFDTHSTRNREGKLTCKYLASISCTNCFENGHTISHCRAKKLYNSKTNAKTGGWVSIKKTNRRLEPNSAVINNIIGGAFSALVVDDDEEVVSTSSMEKCEQVNEELADTGNYTKLTGNNGSTVTITWAPKCKPIDLFQEFNDRDRRAWADMVDDDE